MNRTGRYIKEKGDALSIYITSEYPATGDTQRTILALQNAGVDLIEVGIPFSDPLADGPVIQDSSMKALANGFTVEGLFRDLMRIKDQVKIPLVPMGYFNTVLQYGLERFLKACKELDIDTVILPDMPLNRYQTLYSPVFKEFEVDPVFLISPQTEIERIREIDAWSNAFIYVVADNSITGSRSGFSDEQKEYFERIVAMELKSPLVIGFGISTRAGFQEAVTYADAAIIGSAFIRAISDGDDLERDIDGFVKSIR